MSDPFSRRATFGPVQRLKRRSVLKLSAIAGGAAIAPWLIACGSSNNNKNTASTAQAPTQAAPAGSPAAGSATAAAQPSGTAAAAPASTNKAPTGQAIILQGADVNFMDPEFRNSVPEANINQHIFDTFLWQNGKTLKQEPWIIESWKSIDPLTWEFKVKSGAKFHDGSDVNADAVAFSLTRHAKAKIGGKPTIASFGKLINFDSASAVDATTVRM